jgi:hypothetical protein
MVYLLLLAALSPPPALPAQVLTDLGHPVYGLLARAVARGVIRPLPLLRPYPLPLVLDALGTIVGAGEDWERGEAAVYLAELAPAGTGRSLAPVHVTLAHDSRWLEDYAGRTTGELSTTGALGRLVSYDGAFEVGLVDPAVGRVQARWTPTTDDSVSGGTSLPIGSTDFTVNIAWSGVVAVGTPRIYFQAGLTRSSFDTGFGSGVVLGAQAPPAGHFSLTYRGDWLTLSSVLLELHARYAEDPETGQVYSIKGTLSPGDPFPAKFLALHTALLTPVSWLDLGLIQPVLFGARFSPLYLVPFQILQYTQLRLEDYDNAVFGLLGRVRLPWGLGLSATLLVDDFNFNEAVKLNFDSGQNKLALETRLTWTPRHRILEDLQAGYTLVTPYMYTHSAVQPINYLSYEHDGAQLGSLLSPNSDELDLKVGVRPLPWLRADLGIRRVRHGGGSVYDDGYDAEGTPTFVDSPSTFLTQAVIETSTQVSVDLRARLRPWLLSVDLRAGYTLEHVRNPGLVAAETPSIGHELRLQAAVMY